MTWNSRLGLGENGRMLRGRVFQCHQVTRRDRGGSLTVNTSAKLSGMSDFFKTLTSSRSRLSKEWKRPFSSWSWMLKLDSLTRRPVITRPSCVATMTASYSGAISLDGWRIDSMINSGARRLAMRSRAGPIRPPSPATLWHFAHWALL